MELVSTLSEFLSADGHRAAVSIVLFSAVLLIVVGAGWLLFPHNPVARRLAEGTGSGAGSEESAVLVRHRNERTPGKGLDRYVTPVNEARRSQIRQWLGRAGYRNPSAVRIYYYVRMLFAFVPLVAATLALPFLLRHIQAPVLVIPTVMSSVFGFYAPFLWIRHRIRRRQRAIKEGFPDALDMLLVCVEAGLGLDAAMHRMAMEIGDAHPVVADEFIMVGAELRAGKSRGDVLRDMAKRVAVDEVIAFVSVLTHSDKFGTSIGDALRVYAAEMREKRRMRAEEKANQLPIKLSLAVSFCTVPAIIIIIMAPAIISVGRAIKQLFNAL
jgi:tight adherence protein C